VQKLVSAAIVAAVTMSAAASQAQTSAPPAPPPADAPAGPTNTTTENATVSLFAGLGYSYGFSVGLGLGARYQWVIVPKGFLHSLPPTMHDEFALEPGFDYFHASYSVVGYNWDYNEFTPLIGALWNIWLNDKLAVYPKLDIGYRIVSWSASYNGMSIGGAHDYLFPVYIEGAAGVIYRIGAVSLRAEVGWEDLRLGAGFSF
jgi:hypothetical protein